MFDPLSTKVMMSISLLMPVFSFLGMLITFKQAKRLFGSGFGWSRKKGVLISLLAGVSIAFAYSTAATVYSLLEDLRFSVPGVLAKTLAFAGLCTIGSFVGTEVASRVVRLEDVSR